MADTGQIAIDRRLRPDTDENAGRWIGGSRPDSYRAEDIRRGYPVGPGTQVDASAGDRV